MTAGVREMTGFEGVGEAVTGAMAGRAVEPYAGERSDPGHFHERDCLNCGTRLTGAYCHQCGQKAHLHRTLRSLAGDFLQGLFNFEGKIWRTLPMLVWRPGEMTRRYIAGERARYVSPVAIYLFTVFLMFAVLNFSGAMPTLDNGALSTGLAQARADEVAKLERLKAERRTAEAKGEITGPLDGRIAAQEQEVAQIDRLRGGGAVTLDADDEIGDAPAWVRPIIVRAQKDPHGFVLNIQDAASKYSWLLIPLSVPFLWLLFPFYRRFRLYDHTVFVTYSLSFMMMLVIAGGLLVLAGRAGWTGLLAFVPPIHMYRQLKGAYQLRWWSALLRTIALTIFAFVAALLFALATIAIGAMN